MDKNDKPTMMHQVDKTVVALTALGSAISGGDGIVDAIVARYLGLLVLPLLVDQYIHEVVKPPKSLEGLEALRSKYNWKCEIVNLWSEAILKGDQPNREKHTSQLISVLFMVMPLNERARSVLCSYFSRWLVDEHDTLMQQEAFYAKHE